MMEGIADNDKRPITAELTDSAPLLGNAEALAERADQDGYLFFRGLLDRERVLSLRHDILELLGRHGLLDPERPLMEGTASEAVSRLSDEDVAWAGLPMPLYKEVQKLESFHELAHEPRLLALYDDLFGERTFVHPRNIGRIILPHPGNNPTPSHQDYLHIQGSERTWTAWIPAGDVPPELGGLALLRGSHKAGLLGVVHAQGAGGLESILCGLDYEWQTCSYEAGDVLTFHSLTVHKSLPNRLTSRIRLSVDYRYQPAADPIDGTSLLPHAGFDWEELYEGWSRKDLMYYWQEETMKRTEFDESIRWQKEKIC